MGSSPSVEVSNMSRIYTWSDCQFNGHAGVSLWRSMTMNAKSPPQFAMRKGRGYLCAERVHSRASVYLGFHSSQVYFPMANRQIFMHALPCLDKQWAAI